MAPEVHFTKKYDHKADIWSIGCIFYQLLTGFYPFNVENGLYKFYDDLNKGIYYIPMTIKLSYEGLNFLHQCLQFDSEKRITW